MVDALSATLRALSFVALFQAAGIAMFLAIFGQRLAACLPALQRIGRNSAWVAIALVILQYSIEAARMSGELAGVMDSQLQSLVLHSPTATALGWRVAGMLCIALALRGRGAAVASSLVGATLAIAAFALLGHTATHADRWVLSLLLLAHLLIVAFWFGALVPLHVAASREPAAIAAAVTESFSKAALRIVPILFLAGLVLGAVLLKEPAALKTEYGQLLLVKIALFALIMALAALNKWRFGPALASGGRAAAAVFRRSLAIEYLLIAAVLSVTAVLTSFYSPD